MKTVFMGTPASAAYVLEGLISSGLHVSAVVTSPDKPKGRGLKLSPSPVAESAQKHQIEILKPLKASDPGFIEGLRKAKPDLIIVVAYGKILPKVVLDIPKHGCINLHASLLPKYRGPSPIQAALLSGDKESGVTIMRLNEKMDEGDIILQEKVQISEDDNAQTLSDRLFVVGSKLLIKAMKEIEEEKAKYTPQDHSKAIYCKMIKKQDGIIYFNKSAEEIVNMIRAFTPWPGASAMFKDKRVKILKGEKGLSDYGTKGLGEVVEIIKTKGLVISTGKGTILIKEVQPENSKPMLADEFVRGYHVEVGDRFE